MAYSVDCWTNTGYNPVNIPDSAAMLGNPSFSLPALDLVQDWGLSEVRVRVSDQPVENVDYVKIGKEYYSCTGISKQASDVATLYLEYDAITSCGGPGAITFLDGVTERHTVADDTMFKYTQDDPLMAPREALQLKVGGMQFKMNESSEIPDTQKRNIVLVESTIDLVDLGSHFKVDNDTGEVKSFNGTGITFSDSTADATGAPDLSVTVPYTKGVDKNTEYTLLYTAIEDIDLIQSPSVKSPGTELFLAESKEVKRGMAVARALGVESAIISQVSMPTEYISVTLEGDGDITAVNGLGASQSTGLPFTYAKVRNNRVLYGQYNKYGMVSAAGSKAEFLPEQINEGDKDAPSIVMVPDPRPDGKPYFRFRTYLGDHSIKNFWNSCIGGLQWREVPLTFNHPSGTALNQQNLHNDLVSAGQAYVGTGKTMTANFVGGAVDRLIDMATSLVGSGTRFTQSSDMLGYGMDAGTKNLSTTTGGQYSVGLGLSNPGSLIGSAVGTMEQAKINRTNFDVYRNNELRNFGFNQSVVVPTVMFPYNTITIRDFVGNGVFVYRYRYSDNDITRIDKLLTMYGYKDTTALTPECFVARQNFDYVQASGVSIGGNIPLWKKAVITSQLNAGVRVWHVKPSPAYYTNNPIRGSK